MREALCGSREHNKMETRTDHATLCCCPPKSHSQPAGVCTGGRCLLSLHKQWRVPVGRDATACPACLVAHGHHEDTSDICCPFFLTPFQPSSIGVVTAEWWVWKQDEVRSDCTYGPWSIVTKVTRWISGPYSHFSPIQFGRMWQQHNTGRSLAPNKANRVGMFCFIVTVIPTFRHNKVKFDLKNDRLSVVKNKVHLCFFFFLYLYNKQCHASFNSTTGLHQTIFQFG